jgi:NTP pyrophosphatase (non-canonical NTP hydrolase)
MDHEAPTSPPALSVRELQQMIQQMFGHKDQQRGIDGTFMWFMEEVGELAGALRARDTEQLQGEFADVLAWLVTLANLTGIDLQEAISTKYCLGCPRCHEQVCRCQMSAKP